MRTIWFFVFLFGYMLFRPFRLIRGLKAVKRGDYATADAIAYKNVPIWCTKLLQIGGIEVTVTGQENIPQDRACVFAANHRSMADILLMLTQLGKPMPLISKIENRKLPLISDWMVLLHCLFLDRDNPRQGLKIINEGTELLQKGYNVGIFPEGTRYKGEEGGLGTFLGGAFRMASKAEAPIVPVVIYNSRSIFEGGKRFGIKPCKVAVHILPAIETEGLDRAALKALPAQVEEQVREELQKGA